MSYLKNTKLAAVLGKNKYLLIALIAGVVLLLIPFGTGEKNAEEKVSAQAVGFSLAAQERRLEAQLGKIKGAGRVSVLLSVDGSGERVLAVSGEETLVISSTGGSGEEVVEINYVNPEYTGAIIVCDGAASATVRLEVTRAAQAFTGLPAGSILVIEME